jgi:hypothetical protein
VSISLGGPWFNDLGVGLVVGLRPVAVGPWRSRIRAAESILVAVWGVFGIRLALGCPVLLS